MVIHRTDVNDLCVFMPDFIKGLNLDSLPLVDKHNRGESCLVSMETLKEIRDTEKKARELIEKARMESEALVTDTKSRAKSLLAEASEESEKIRKEIQEQAKELAVDDTKALEKAYEEKVIDLKKRIGDNQDKAVQLILNSILPEDQ